jgi:hypothetical protein
MRAGLFWLNDKQWAWIAPHLPTNLTGSGRDDDRRIISGVIHMLQCIRSTTNDVPRSTKLTGCLLANRSPMRVVRAASALPGGPTALEATDRAAPASTSP